MNILSFQTAVRLKEAGFPQPTPAPGQFWYAKKPSGGTDLFLMVEGNAGRVFGVLQGKHDPFDCREISSNLYSNWRQWLIFAPTATDILEQLGNRYVMWFDESPKVQKWCVARAGDSVHDTGTPFLHDNPHEAAAAAWLELNKKQDEQK